MMNKYTFSLLVAFSFSSLLKGQYANNVLDVNDASVRFMSNGLIGWNGDGSLGYFIPKTPDNSGPSPLFEAGMWIGGLDSVGTLHLAGETFEQNGHDFFPGPLGTDASISPATSYQYNQLWKVLRSDAEEQVAYYTCLADPNCDTQVEFPGYSVPPYFYQWPAHGDVSLGQAYNLAPFYDFNGDGNYNPADGDAPCIPGDMALFNIYNDKLAPHTESGGNPIGVEVHMTSFEYSSNTPAIDQTVFIRYQIFNRGSLALHDTYIGLFNDFDLGCGGDDYLQCDAHRNLNFALNSDNIDEDCFGEVGYGMQPPAFGQVILQGPLMAADGIDNTDTLTLPGYSGTGFNDGIIDNERSGMSYCLDFKNTNSGFQHDPTNSSDYYNYMRGQWLDGTPMTYGGVGYSLDPSAVVTHYMYPGDTDPLGVGTNGQIMPPWTEASAGSEPQKLRGVASMGPFTLTPGQEEDIVVAYVYARAISGGPAASVEALRLRTDSIRAFAETIPGLLSPGSPCDELPTGILGFSARDQKLQLYPNPATDQLSVNVPGINPQGLMNVIDTHGALVLSQEVKGASNALDVGMLTPGLYLVRVQVGAKYLSARFTKR
jgi:hypothetical protein